MKIYYLSGPMTGIPDLNRPLFKKAAEYVRKAGLTILSPPELHPEDDSYGKSLGRDIEVLIDSKVDGVVFLQNWWYSRGARIEAFTALCMDVPEYFLFKNEGSWDVSADRLVQNDYMAALTADNIRATLKQFMP